MAPESSIISSNLSWCKVKRTICITDVRTQIKTAQIGEKEEKKISDINNKPSNLGR